jgi:hypothetical protein
MVSHIPERRARVARNPDEIRSSQVNERSRQEKSMSYRHPRVDNTSLV